MTDILRYFFICTFGKNEDQSMTLNNFDVKTINTYPTIRRLIELSLERYPNQKDVTILGITEMNEVDFNKFISEQ